MPASSGKVKYLEFMLWIEVEEEEEEVGGLFGDLHGCPGNLFGLELYQLN